MGDGAPIAMKVQTSFIKPLSSSHAGNVIKLDFGWKKSLRLLIFSISFLFWYLISPKESFNEQTKSTGTNDTNLANPNDIGMKMFI